MRLKIKVFFFPNVLAHSKYLTWLLGLDKIDTDQQQLHWLHCAKRYLMEIEIKS